VTTDYTDHTDRTDGRRSDWVWNPEVLLSVFIRVIRVIRGETLGLGSILIREDGIVKVADFGSPTGSRSDPKS